MGKALRKLPVVLTTLNAIGPEFLNPTWLWMQVGNTQNPYRNDPENDRKSGIDPHPEEDDQAADNNNPYNLSKGHGTDLKTTTKSSISRASGLVAQIM